MEATITCSLDLFDGMRNQIKTFIATEVDLKKQLAEAQLNAVGENGAGAALMSAIKAAMKVVQFAVGNLDPETIRGWPHQELAVFAELMKTFPGTQPGDAETAEGFMVFAKQAAAVDVARAFNVHPDIALIKRSSLGVTGSYETQIKKMVSDRAAVAQKQEEQQADDGQQEQQS